MRVLGPFLIGAAIAALIYTAIALLLGDHVALIALAAWVGGIVGSTKGRDHDDLPPLGDD